MNGSFNEVARVLAILIVMMLMAACAAPAMKEDIRRGPVEFSKPRAVSGVLYGMAEGVMAEHGRDHSAFRLLDSSYDGLMARLALIDSAVSSIDVQTYLWYPDFSGLLVLERLIDAANRGVYVRLILDDLLTIGHDQAIYELDNHPNIEFRLFNPWQDRGTLSRGFEMLVHLERMNHRMHDKLVVVDGNAAIVGGRNIGNHYFGLSADYNFHDLDLLGFGHIAKQSADMFDHFWNSEWVVSGINLDTEPDPAEARRMLESIRETLRSAPERQAFPVERNDWSGVLERLQREWHIGTSELVWDSTTEETIEQSVATELFPWMAQATRELLITNAYVIPEQPAIDFIGGLVERGVDVAILTNSLASHDVPAVNSHYKEWRDDFIRAGARLYEARPDPATAGVVNVPPVEAEFIGLHTKAFVVDREKAFIGSMNFDPRSVNINTEAGAFVHSPGLAGDLARVMERDMHPDNAWQVFLDEEGELYWVNSDERVDKQPARGYGQRIMDKLLKIIPKDQN